MGRPPVPDSLAGERGPDDLPAVPAGRRGGTSASAEREPRPISRCRNPRRQILPVGRTGLLQKCTDDVVLLLRRHHLAGGVVFAADPHQLSPLRQLPEALIGRHLGQAKQRHGLRPGDGTFFGGIGQQPGVLVLPALLPAEISQADVLHPAPDQGGPHHLGQPGLVQGPPGVGRQQHVRVFARPPASRRRPQQAPQGDAQGQVPVRQPQQAPVQIHLVPGQGRHLPDLHPQLPAHPQGQPHRGAALRLEQLPHQKTVHLPPGAGGLLPSLRQIVGENSVQSGDGDAADPGHIGPVVGFQLADDEVVPQIHQADAAQPRPVQGLSGQAGNGLRRHLLPAAVRDHHEGGGVPGTLRLPAQAVLGLRLQRDGPVRQPELMGGKVHIVPGQALDLLPGQALPPGQAEDQPRRRLRLLRQKPGHGPGVRPSHGCFAHVPSPPGQGGARSGRLRLYDIRAEPCTALGAPVQERPELFCCLHGMAGAGARPGCACRL